MKKIISTILVVALLVTALSACGSQSSSESNDTSEVSEEIEESSENESEVIEEEESEPKSEAEPVIPEAAEETPELDEQEDMTAEEPEIEEEEDNYFPLDTPETLSIWYPFPSNIADFMNGYDEHPVFEAAQEATNVTIEFVSCSDYQTNEQFSLMCASGDYCDMITQVDQNYSNGLVGALDDEVIISLDAYLESAPNYMGVLDLYPEAKRAIKTDDGQIAMFAWIEGEQFVTSGPQIRQDWLDALGMEIPETYSELEEYLTAVKSEYGCTSPYLVNSSSFADILADGYGVVGCSIGGPDSTASEMYQIDGVVHCSFVEDGYRDYLTMMNDWYEKGLFSQDFLNISSNPMDSIVEELITTDQTGAWFDSVDSLATYMSLKEGTGFDVSPMSAPGIEGYSVSHFGSEYNHVMGNTVSVSTQCDNVELAVRWLDYFYSEEGALLANYGIEGIAYDYDDDGNLYVTDLLLNNPDGLTYNQTAYLYTLGGNFITYTAVSKSALTWTWQYDFVETNAQNYDSDYVLPSSVTLTQDESDSIANILSDLETYADEMITKFVVGDADIETEWDSMVAYLNENGMQTCIDVYQAALDRYMSR